MKSIFRAAMLALACSSPSAVLAQGDATAASPDLIKSCEACHGPGGNSTVSTTPRLNGQHAEYIVARLKDFLDVTRETPHASYNMWVVVTNLQDSARSAIAAYFARQTPAQPKPGSQASLGKQIYENGVSVQGIPACAGCHGPQGEGQGAVPRLAGQHADYLKTQLWVFSFQLRENNVMHPNTNKIHGDQVDALASYLAGD